jgi:hypothetical protein
MAEDKFLAFQGLKQYDPDSGWASVDPAQGVSSAVPSLEDREHGEHDFDHGHSYSQGHTHMHSERMQELYIDPEFEQDFNDLSMSSHTQRSDSRASSSLNTTASHAHAQRVDHNASAYPEAHMGSAKSARTGAGEEHLSDPLLSELFEQLHQPPQDELTQSWKIIATSVNILSQRMAQRKDLQERIRKLDLELETLRSNILHDLEDIQKTADQQLSMARLRAEVSTLAQARLASRLKKNHSSNNA